MGKSTISMAITIQWLGGSDLELWGIHIPYEILLDGERFGATKSFPTTY